MANRRFLNWLWPFNWINRVPSQLARIVLRMMVMGIFLGILANTYHFTLVYKYPLRYRFPEHSFRVVDSETRLPIEGAVAVYIYEQFPIYNIEIGTLFIPFIDPVLLFSDYWEYSTSVRVGLAEGVSNTDGWLTVPEYGPMRRRRNHYFYENQPYMHLFKSGYEVDLLNNRGHLKENYWGFPATIIPSWSGSEIRMNRFTVETVAWKKDWGLSFEELYGAYVADFVSEIYSKKLRVPERGKYFREHLPMTNKALHKDYLSRGKEFYPAYEYDLGLEVRKPRRPRRLWN